MKHLRLVPAAAVLGSLVLTAAIAFACSDKAKTTTASAKSSTVTASNGACTAEQMAACAKGAKGVKASMASAAGMSGDACCMSKSKKAANTTATVAPVGKVNAMAVGSNGASGKVDAVATGSSCGVKSAAKTTAMAAGSGSSCSGHGVTGTAKATGHDCEACADLAMCENEVKANGANVQIVPLKNGVMYVYTATGAAKVSAVQAAMTRRNQHVTSILASGEQATLCGECKSMRGAIASGKLNRETVNIEGGCMTLVTSSDPAMVTKIYSLAGLKANGRNKS